MALPSVGGALKKALIEMKAKYERKIAELFSPTVEQEVPVSEASQLLSQFADVWDSRMVTELIQ